MRILNTFLWLAAVVCAQPVTIPSSGDRYGAPPNPQRDAWQKPDQVLGSLRFSSTETVVVIESGYPYFARRIAPLVNKVYAVNSDARAFQGPGKLPPSISTIVAASNALNIASLRADTVIAVDVLRSVPQRAAFYLSVIAGMRPGGRLVIIDRTLPSVFPQDERVTGQQVTLELPLLGFTFSQQYSVLPYQYFLVFQR